MSKPRTTHDLTRTDYTPNVLLTAIAARLGVESYSDIARAMRVDPALICNFRKRRQPLTPLLVLRIMEVAGMTLDEIRQLSGVDTWVPLQCSARHEKMEQA